METARTSEQYPNGWHRTFYTLWLGSFITGAGYSMTMPFISLFINELGNFSHFQLNIYSGLAFGATFISQAIVSPLWGNLADRKGRKLMCMRAAGVMSCTIFLVGLAQNVWWIIGLRFLQGAFSSYINNATALMAGETPRSHSGWVMSSMTTAGVAGNLVGPLLGGALSGAFGRIFSLNQSFQAVGAVLGSIIGSVISGLFNYPMVFAVTGFILFFNMVAIWIILRPRPVRNQN